MANTPSLLEPFCTLHNSSFELYIPAETIHRAITRVAEQINQDYTNIVRPLLLVTLSGAVVFGGELFRQLRGPFEIAFVKLASYGAGTTSSGVVSVDVPLTADVRGRDVLIAEDVGDTGTTIHSLRDMLHECGASSIRVATLLPKSDIY